ncbi:MAG TPA: PAS domain S-box protein [Microvirga sp.]|nr:PAS domain S-box protein [Microvirga sp.]
MREQLDAVLRRAAIGIAQIDPGGRYLLANERYCAMLGRGQEQVVGAELQDFVQPEDLPTCLERFIRVLETGEPAAIEHRVVREDGSTLWIGNTVSAAHDERGQPQYAVLLAQDVTARKETERALARSKADLRMMIDSAAEGMYCIDRNGLVTLCNAAFLRMLGFAREEEVIGKDAHEIIHHSYPDGSPYPKANCPVYKTAVSGVHVHLFEDIYFRRDGTHLPIECWARPILRDSEIEGAVCTFVDITERKQAEARQQMLNHELAHRVKNTLAMVQAIVGQSLRNSPATRDAVMSINQRLIALGNAHSILTQTRWGNASIMDVVESAVAVHRPEPDRIRTVGPKIDIGPKAALGLTMALHELCTNATKYGALSNGNGVVSIEWAVIGGAADARFQLLWRERGGPPVTPPTRQGFGSRLIAESVGADLKGDAKLEFDPAGVMWSLEVPLKAVG